MEFVQYSALYIARNMGLMIIDPIFYLLAITVIYLYKRQIRQFQCTKDDSIYTYHAIKNIVIGSVIGLFGSSLLAYLGIAITIESNVLLLIPVAMALMMITPKFGCFSYVVAVAYIIEGILESFTVYRIRLDYEVLVVLVGALHIIEGFLVIVRGADKSINTVVCRNNRLTVQEILHQIWLVPIVFMIPGYNYPIPVYAILAYNDLANKKEAIKQSLITGSLILLFGLFITSLAYFGRKGLVPMGGIIILMPIAHEFIFLISQYTKKQDIF